jgi:hypothetical protein
MSEKRPHYAASVFADETLRLELAPISIFDAKDDSDAHAIAMDRARRWMAASHVNRAWLKIVKNGSGLTTSVRP